MTKERLSADELARRLGDVSASGVGKWVRGDRVPRADQQRRIYELTGGAVTPNDFVLPTDALHKAGRA